MALRAGLACVLLVLVLAACGGGSGSGGSSSGEPPDLPAPPNAMELARKAGLVPERAEFLEYHVHAHLDVFFDGDPVTVPAGIGIDTGNPAVVSDAQGVGLTRKCDRPCISPLHTHETDGVLHTETKTPAPNNLGQFFAEWDVRLSSSCVGDYCEPETSIAIYIDGEEYDGDPRKIELSDGREIAVVIGSPPDAIPSVFPR
jgi:hypothetical protein